MIALKNRLNRRGISKAEILDLAGRLNDDLFAELIRLIVEEKPPVNQKAAWVFNHGAKLHPNFYEKNYPFLLEHLEQLNPDGVKRDVLRGMLNLPVKNHNLGLLADICLKWLNSSTIDVAVKYNSMRTLERIVKMYPDLKDEFHSTLRSQLDLNTDTFKRSALKVLS